MRGAYGGHRFGLSRDARNRSAQGHKVTMRAILVLRMMLLTFACLLAGQVDAARWESHRASALQAIDEAETTKAIEQFEAAIYYAQQQPAADRDIADLWERLTAAYLADGQFRRAWDAIARWDKILSANAGQDWAAERQRRRDQMTRLLFERTRKTPAEGTDGEEPAGLSAPRLAAEASERPVPQLAPAGEPVHGAAAPEVVAAGEPVPQSAPYGIHLASYRNEANARKSWKEMQAQHPDLLKGKTPALRSVELGDRGTFVRLIAVPYANSAAARAICRDLRQRAQYCAVLRSE